MLDYDGTLAPFVRDRFHATLYTGVARRLVRLAQHSRLRLVFVTGRQAHELLRLLPVGIAPEIWGSHGREHLLPDGRYHASALTAAQTSGLRWLNHSLGERGFAPSVEMKTGSMALHTRGLSAAEEQELTSLAAELFTHIASSGFNLLPFDGGVEIRAEGCSKATALESILSNEPEDAVAAYLGDDQTDEDAFEALQERGLRVLVREAIRPTAADLWLRPPNELLAFLDQWLAVLSEASSITLQDQAS